jgi:hypothetical protein
MAGILCFIALLYIILLIVISIEVKKYRNSKLALKNSISNDNECICTNGGICRLKFKVKLIAPQNQIDLSSIDFEMAYFCSNLIACIEAPWAYNIPDKTIFPVPISLTKIKDIYYKNSIIGFIAADFDTAFVTFKGTTTQDEWKQNFEWALMPFSGFSSNSSENNIGLGPTTYSSLSCSPCSNDSKNLQDIFPDNSQTITARQTNFENRRSIQNDDQTFIIRGRVHQGWLEIYKQVEKEIISILNMLPLNVKNLVISGHSLGGAISTLMLADNNVPIRFHENTVTYVFGSPRVGNEEFANYLKNENRHLFSFININDIVPQIPLTVMPNVKEPNKPYLYAGCGKSEIFEIQRKSFLNNHSMACYLFYLENKK